MPAPVNFGRGHRFAAYPRCSTDVVGPSTTVALSGTLFRHADEEGAVTRRDDEAPAATDRWGWRYHHTGIPTDKPRAGERYLAQFKMYVSGFPESPYGIEWMRFDADSPISELVRTVPHVAFEVDDIEEALKGKTMLPTVDAPSAGVRVAMIIDNGCPIELIQFTKAE